MKDRKQQPVYAYPRLSKTDLLFVRIGGNGLGNLMFTWARCLAQSNRHGWRMIWPTWPSFKPKNWRVNPHNHRTYSDLFQANETCLSGWRKPWCLARYRWISEGEAIRAGAPPGSVVEFRGMKDFFKPFLNDHGLVYEQLKKIARKQHLAAYSEPNPAPVGIHVRRGDFITRSDEREVRSSHNSLLPLEWYIDALNAAREKAGFEVPAFVYSDGTEDELRKLVSMPGVRRMNYGSSLGDMFGLARSRLLIASGSTFSMWGSYLGQVPAIWYPGKRLQHLLVEHPEREIEWAPGHSMPEWIQAVTQGDTQPAPGPRHGG